MKKSIGLYIHIPFCKAKCHYCDFNSFSGREEHIPAYFNALTKEIEIYSKKMERYSIRTVFIGGGTPSFVDEKFITRIMAQCKNSFQLEPDAEITLESNPGTLSFDKLSAYRGCGINRLSIGLQAWQDHLLKSLGRIHNVDVFLTNFAQARKAGFHNINVDLIFGLPDQTLADWLETVAGVAGLGAEHLSCYSLKIEEGTVFEDKLEAGGLKPIEDELDREMYHAAIEMLRNKGLAHYEISNFSKPGFECRHNLVYWKAQEYLGLGAGAHSYLEGTRFSNTCCLENYTNTILGGEFPAENKQLISKEESMSEFIILGMRLIGGISANEFRQRYEEDIFKLYSSQIESLSKRKLVEVVEDGIKLTKTGLDLANEVFVEFI